MRRDRRAEREGSVHIDSTTEITRLMTAYEFVIATVPDRVDDVVAAIARAHPERSADEWERLLLTKRLYIGGRRAAVHRDVFGRSQGDASRRNLAKMCDIVASAVSSRRMH